MKKSVLKVLTLHIYRTIMLSCISIISSKTDTPSLTAGGGERSTETRVEMSLKLLKAGKHVLQEKPAAVSVKEAETALAFYNSIYTEVAGQPIWAVAENYRFEPAFVESKKLMAEIGDMMSIQVIIEGSMNSSNPYFSSIWRRNFNGGFVLDMGVHFIAGLRMCPQQKGGTECGYFVMRVLVQDAIRNNKFMKFKIYGQNFLLLSICD